jgi:hypothetical protein
MIKKLGFLPNLLQLKTNRHNFSLVELLVVFSILMVLISLLSPAMKTIMERSTRVSCLNTQKNFSVMVKVYAYDYARVMSRTDWGWKRVPYLYSKTRMIDPLVEYGFELDDFFCPGDPNYPYLINNNIAGQHVMSNILLLAGIAEVSPSSYWYDDVPSAASSTLMDGPQKIMVTDFNFWATWGGGVMYSNHGGGRISGPVSLMTEVIQGGNRIYSDGRGEWVEPDEMGKNFTPVTEDASSSHYSHMGGGLRPYWW